MAEGTEEVSETRESHPVRDQTIAGLIVLGVGTAVTWVFGQLSAAKVPIGWYFAGVAAVAIIATFVYPTWRRAIWGNVAKWRPFTTQKSLDDAHAAGRAELQTEIDAEVERNRHRPMIRAQWLIVHEDEDGIVWTLANMAKGSIAKHVSVEVSSAYFRTASALDWDEVNGGGRVTFSGAPTQSGYDYPFAFRVSWTDANDERQAINVQSPTNR